MSGVSNICIAGRIEINVIEMPVSAARSAARGVTFRTQAPMKPPKTRTTL
jgi:hypothetical protein